MISYNPLWKTLIDKHISKPTFRKDCNIQKQTYADMNNDKFISLRTIDKICDFLQCNIEDVIEHVPSNQNTLKK